MLLSGEDFEVLKAPESIKIIFSSTMENIDKVCNQATEFLELNLADIKPALFSINLVIREGLTNAVRHGNVNDSSKTVQFLLTIVEKQLIRIRIEDQGNGFDWKKQQEEELPEDLDHGRGIIIMKTYFTRYSYNEKGNVLTLEKNIT